MENITAEEAAKQLGISLENLRTLQKQGLIHSKLNAEGKNSYSSAEIARIKSRHDPTVADQAALVGIQIQRDVVTSVSSLMTLRKRIFIIAAVIISVFALLFIIFAILFYFYPLQTSNFFGYYFRFNQSGQQASVAGEKNSKVLGASTGPGGVVTQTTLLADIIKPIAAASLVAVKAVDGQKYQEIVTNPIEIIGTSGLTGSPGIAGANGLNGANGADGAEGQQGPTGAQGTVGANGTSGTNGTNGSNGTNGTSVADVLTTPGSMIIRNGLNTTVPLIAGANGQVLTISAGIPTWQTSPSVSGLTVGSFASPNLSQWTNDSGFITASSTDVLLNKTISGLTNTLTNIPNSALTNSSLTVNAGAGLSGGGLASLGGTISLFLPSVGSAGTYGNGTTIPVLTTDSQGRVTNVANTAITGLTTANFLSTNLSQWTNNLGYVSSSSADTLTNKTIAAGSNTITGLTNANLSGAAGITNANLANSSLTVVGGTGLSGGGLISLGGSTTLSLPNTGTAGTFGSASAIPVFVTDAQGRITSSVNTPLAGLTTANFNSTNISQWTNNSGFITATSVDTLSSKSLSGLTNTFTNIPNGALTNSSITVTAGTGLSGGGLVSLGGTVSLSLPNVGTAGTFGSATTIPVLTTDAQGRVTSVTTATVSGLTVASFSGALLGDVSGNQTTTSVDKIKGAVLGSTTATSGNILIGSGTQWATQALSGDATINSSGLLTLKNTGVAGTYGSALNIPVLTTDAQGRVTGVVNTTIAGLAVSNFSSANISQWTNNSGFITASSADTLTNKIFAAGSNTLSGITAANLTAGDFSSKINSGTYSINISGNAVTATTATSATTATTATNFSGSLAGDITGTQGVTVVGKINGATLGSTTASSGNLLIGSGASWVTHAVSGDATINSAGLLTLKNTGTAGTFGTALNVPVLTTDAQGRITAVVNTAIAGLTTSTFSSANISQWTNNSGYLTSEADTLLTVTGRGATTATGLVLNGGITTTTSTALTMDSGTTGAVSIATGANAKLITLGNVTAGTKLTLSAGTLGVFINGLAAQTNGKLTVCIDAATKQLFTGATAASCNTSSERFKHDISDITLGLNAVKQLRPVSFAYNSDGEKDLGFIAEEVANVDERLIVRDSGALPYAINSDEFIPILTKAIQQMSDFLGEISPIAGAENLVASIQSESPVDPVSLINGKIADGKQLLSDFIALRVTAIRGYFDEVFTRKIYAQEICFKKTDGNEVCVNGDQMSGLLPNSVEVKSALVVNPPVTVEPESKSSQSAEQATTSAALSNLSPNPIASTSAQE